jgi:8-oxo-dGTP diphosphatase
MPLDPRVSVGAVAVVFRNGKVLLGKRKGKHAAGVWALAGGWVDYGEDPADAAMRELKEEFGLSATPGGLIGYTNNVFEEKGFQSVTMFFHANKVKGEPVNMEPDKCEEVRWFGFDEISADLPMFPGLKDMLLTRIPGVMWL